MTESQAAAWLVARVKSTPTLAVFGGRIFPDAAPDGAINPCMIYQMIEAGDESRIDPGAQSERMAAFQIRIYARSRSIASNLREQFRQAFQNHPPVDLTGWRLTGTAWGPGADTYEPQLKDYGATGVLEIHGD